MSDVEACKIGSQDHNYLIRRVNIDYAFIFLLRCIYVPHAVSHHVTLMHLICTWSDPGYKVGKPPFLRPLFYLIPITSADSDSPRVPIWRKLRISRRRQTSTYTARTNTMRGFEDMSRTGMEARLFTHRSLSVPRAKIPSVGNTSSRTLQPSAVSLLLRTSFWTPNSKLSFWTTCIPRRSSPTYTATSTVGKHVRCRTWTSCGKRSTSKQL